MNPYQKDLILGLINFAYNIMHVQEYLKNAQLFIVLTETILLKTNAHLLALYYRQEKLQQVLYLMIITDIFPVPESDSCMCLMVSLFDRTVCIWAHMF